jgi:hypothetical protein
MTKLDIGYLPNFMLRLRICFVLLALDSAFAQSSKPAGPVDFQRDVRPILSDNCFACHGPDEGTRMAGLRLDKREGAFSERKSGEVIVPGKPESSILYKRIAHDNEALRMPPIYSNKSLSQEQKDTLRRWIQQGASWKEHWAFNAPVRRSPPTVSAKEWVRNPIDSYLLATLEARGLLPAPEADRRRLIRRVSLDLTGLPPAPADVEAFVNDPAPDAYEKVVDRLLASPHYGEHRARYWLDAARYADTHGIHIDNYREMWPYRDWVIQAFNRNLSFDRFTIEQLAGDLLPNRTVDQQIASGFHRCNMTTNEGGSIEEEVAAIYAKDRVETTATVWLGLTAGCASCHDHKFDPILQKEFYQFAAFFRNTVQKPMDGNIPDTPPIIVLPGSQDVARWDSIRSESARMLDLKQQRRAAAQAGFEAWVDKGGHANPSSYKPLDGDSYSIETADLTLPAGVTLADGPSTEFPALRFGEKAMLALPGVDDFDADQPFSIAAWVYMPTGDENYTIASRLDTKNRAEGEKESDEDGKEHGWAIETNERIPSLRLSFDSGGSLRIRGSNVQRLRPGAWTHLTFIYDGSRYQSGLSMYVNGESVVNESGDAAPELKGNIRTLSPLSLGAGGKKYFNGGAIADFRIYRRTLRQEESQILASWPVIRSALDILGASLTGEQRNALLLFYLNRYDSVYRELEDNLDELAKERRAIRRRSVITHVMEEKAGSMPVAQVLFRGQYDQPREEVAPDVPGVLPRLPESAPRNRLGLAEWLVDPANPLTARVTVNRFWQEVFGAGLVRTTEDVGSQGEAPSHPELLDWLAVEFRESGWDMKKLFRLMVTSAAYRQSAATTEDKLRKDPDNRLLSRGPRFRMDAEMVRDLALASSRLLVRAIGGPSVKPYQPDGLWETVAMKGSNTRFYKQDHGEKLFRRSLYTFWKRSAPPASMEIFNAPTRENCAVRRERTDTPLQALVTMNDVQFVEAARNLAQVAIMEGQDDFDRRVDMITTLVLARKFGDKERDIVKRELRDLLLHYDSHPDEARKLLEEGESKPEASISTPEFAAWTILASNILNLDEALNK